MEKLNMYKPNIIICTLSTLINLFTDILKNTVKCFTDGMVYNGYPCRNSDVCIPLGWLCDSQKDCLGKL